MPEKEGKVAVKNQYWNSRRGGADRAGGTIQKMKGYLPHHRHHSVTIIIWFPSTTPHPPQLNQSQ